MRKENLVINFNEKNTFGEMLDKLSKDNTLSFYNKNKVYFKRKDKFLMCDYSNGTANTTYSTEIALSEEIINKTFYLTNLYISDVVFEIDVAQVRDYLIAGHELMLDINEHIWYIELDDDEIILDYSEDNFDVTEDNVYEKFVQDILQSLLIGEWYVIDKE